jgi:hypothetical protein
MTSIERSTPTVDDPVRRALCGAGAAASALAVLGCASLPREHRIAAPPVSQVAPFSASPPDGELPPGWRPYSLRPDRGTTSYRSIDFEGRTVLSAQARAACSAAQYEFDVDPVKRPWVQWQWRVDALIPGARVDVDELDDSPARLVLAFDTPAQQLTLGELIFFDQVELVTGKRLPNASLLYVWDAQLPVGTVVHHKRTGRIRYLVVESGPARLGRWASYRRNVLADFAAVYREPVARISAVGVLTDSDDLRTTAEALYGDISLLPDSASRLASA